MTVVEMATLHAKEGRGNDLAAVLPAALENQASIDGCLRVDSYQCVERPDECVIVIEWNDLDAHERFRRSEARDRWRSVIADALDDVGVWGHYLDLQAADTAPEPLSRASN